MRTPPFGMDTEISQVITGGPHYFNKVSATEYIRPDGKPSCYETSTKPCEGCPWRNSCKNAEGRI